MRTFLTTNVCILMSAIYFLPLRAAAENTVIDAPFGLEWGIKKVDLESAGIILSGCKDLGWAEQCTTESVPKNMSIAESYVFAFTKRYGLQKAVMVSKDFTSDLRGSEGKGVYSTLKKALEKKYGSNAAYEWSGRSLYNESDEFYQCLAYDGCGSWSTFWVENMFGAITLELKGLGRGKGFLRLSYEGGRWKSAMDEKDELNEAADFDAL